MTTLVCAATVVHVTKAQAFVNASKDIQKTTAAFRALLPCKFLGLSSYISGPHVRDQVTI